MTCRLVYTHRAVKDLDALDTSVKRRIGNTSNATNSILSPMPSRSNSPSWVPIGFVSATIAWSLILRGNKLLCCELGIGGTSINVDGLSVD